MSYAQFTKIEPIDPVNYRLREQQARLAEKENIRREKELKLRETHYRIRENRSVIKNNSKLTQTQINNLTESQKHSLGIFSSPVPKIEIQTSRQQKSSEKNNENTLKSAPSKKDYEKSLYQRAKQYCEKLWDQNNPNLGFCIKYNVEEFRRSDEIKAKYE